MPTDQTPARPLRRVVVRRDDLVWRISLDGVPHSEHLGEAEAMERARKLAREFDAELVIVGG